MVAASRLALCLLGLVAVPAIAAPCATSSYKIRAARVRRNVKVGTRFTLAYHVRNHGPSTTNVALGVVLPPGAIVQKNVTSATSKRTPYTNAAVETTLTKAYGLYYRAAPLKPGKGRRYRARILVAACRDETIPSSLLFQSHLLEIVIPTNSVACEMAGPVQTVNVLEASKTVGEADDVCPLNYHLTSVGKRCAEGTQAADYFGTLSPDQCFAYCATLGGAPSPFYFSYGTNEASVVCSCAGSTCTLVDDPNYLVYKTLPGAPVPPIPDPEPLPQEIDQTVLQLSDVLYPVGPGGELYPLPGVWSGSFGVDPSITNVQIMPVTNAAAIREATGFPDLFIDPALTNGPIDSALLLQNVGNSNQARAAATMIFYPEGAFNGMLFKDFVLGGATMSFAYYPLQGQLGGNNAIPRFSIGVRTSNPVNGDVANAYANFVWTPDMYANAVINQWNYVNMDESEGNTEDWINGQTISGSKGFWCTSRCFTGNALASVSSGEAVRRSLRTFVEDLLANATTKPAIETAIIERFSLSVGSSERNRTMFVADYNIATNTGPYSWSYDFGAESA